MGHNRQIAIRCRNHAANSPSDSAKAAINISTNAHSGKTRIFCFQGKFDAECTFIVEDQSDGMPIFSLRDSG